MTDRIEYKDGNTPRPAKREWVSPSLRVIAGRDAESAAPPNLSGADGVTGYS